MVILAAPPPLLRSYYDPIVGYNDSHRPINSLNLSHTTFWNILTNLFKPRVNDYVSTPLSRKQKICIAVSAWTWSLIGSCHTEVMKWPRVRKGAMDDYRMCRSANFQRHINHSGDAASLRAMCTNPRQTLLTTCSATSGRLLQPN